MFLELGANKRIEKRERGAFELSLLEVLRFSGPAAVACFEKLVERGAVLIERSRHVRNDLKGALHVGEGWRLLPRRSVRLLPSCLTGLLPEGLADTCYE